jgi:hypothetical protein
MKTILKPRAAALLQALHQNARDENAMRTNSWGGCAMDLMKLLRSLEEFVFEAIALLFFYPKTLVRITIKPMQAMQYAELEEAANKTNPYDDAVSPPLLLLVTLLIANGIGLALHVPQAAEATPLARALLDSPQNLLMFRSVLFSVIPLTAAVLLLRKQRQAVSRTTLRQPFFAQCYLASPFALIVSLSVIAGQTSGRGWTIAGAMAGALAFAWMVAVQAVWFRRKLGISRFAALALGLVLLGWAFACLIVLMVFVVIF